MAYRSGTGFPNAFREFRTRTEIRPANDTAILEGIHPISPISDRAGLYHNYTTKCSATPRRLHSRRTSAPGDGISTQRTHNGPSAASGFGCGTPSPRPKGFIQLHHNRQYYSTLQILSSTVTYENIRNERFRKNRKKLDYSRTKCPVSPSTRFRLHSRR